MVGYWSQIKRQSIIGYTKQFIFVNHRTSNADIIKMEDEACIINEDGTYLINVYGGCNTRLESTKDETLTNQIKFKKVKTCVTKITSMADESFGLYPSCSMIMTLKKDDRLYFDVNLMDGSKYSHKLPKNEGNVGYMTIRSLTRTSL